jgi:hypothetical protein
MFGVKFPRWKATNQEEIEELRMDLDSSRKHASEVHWHLHRIIERNPMETHCGVCGELRSEILRDLLQKGMTV